MDINQYIRTEIVKQLKEQSVPTDTADNNTIVFDEFQKKFLANFAKNNTTSLGLIYSITDIGIQEFIDRSGEGLSLNLGTLKTLLQQKIIKIVPYSGYGRDDNYTIELQISLDNLKDLNTDEEESDDETTGADETPSNETPAGNDDIDSADDTDTNISISDIDEWIINYSDLLEISAASAKTVVAEYKSSDKKKVKVYSKASRALKRLPSGYIFYLEKIITILGNKLHSTLEKQMLVADILDNLAHNFGLTPKQIHTSYSYYKSQRRLQKLIGTND